MLGHIFVVRFKLYQVVIQLPELPHPVDTRTPRQIRWDHVSGHHGADRQQRDRTDHLWTWSETQRCGVRAWYLDH